MLHKFPHFLFDVQWDVKMLTNVMMNLSASSDARTCLVDTIVNVLRDFYNTFTGTSV